MSDPSTFDFNGYKIKVPPKGKFAQGVPAIGNVWPSAAGTPIVSSYLVYDFAYPKVAPLVMIQSYTSYQEPVGTPGQVDGTFRKDSVSPVPQTMTVAREIEMSYQWRAVIVELNTAGGYEQDKTFVTGVQTSQETSETFGRVLGAEASTNIPLFKGIDVKLTAAYNKAHTAQSKTTLTTSSTVTEKITAPANQTFVQWQLFIEHTIKAPNLSAESVNPPDFDPYDKLFYTYGGTGIPARYPQVSIVNAPQLSGGGAIYSSTMYPAT